MFFRKKADEPLPAAPAAPTTGKGHATPSRRESQAARQRPLVGSGSGTTKEERRRARDQAYSLQNDAMRSGDPRLERYLPARDQGAVRRYVRDYVDARWNIAELFVPVAVLGMATIFLRQAAPEFYVIATITMYVVVFGGILDSLVMSLLLRRRLLARFSSSEIPPGTALYAFTRSFMLRPMRMPKPQVKRGEYPGRSAH